MAGLCTRCGKKPPQENRRLCDECGEKAVQRVVNHRYNRKIKEDGDDRS